jgi:phosphohistidine phosphatase SixA
MNARTYSKEPEPISYAQALRAQNSAEILQTALNHIENIITHRGDDESVSIVLASILNVFDYVRW